MRKRRCFNKRYFFLSYVSLLTALREASLLHRKAIQKLARSVYKRIWYGRVMKIQVGGERWWVPAKDIYFTPPLIIKGTYEPLETRFVRNVIKPGMVVLDIGAHVGYFSCLFASLVGPNGHVYAFEPEPLNRRLLHRNISQRGYDWVTLIPMAASNEIGEKRLFLNPTNSGDNRLASPPGNGVPHVTVRTTRVDEVLNTSTKVGLIKVDVQGWELNVLKGMGQLLESNPEVLILTEFWPEGLRRAGASEEELLSVCRGFRLEPYLLQDGDKGKLVKANSQDLLASCGPHLDAINIVFAHPNHPATMKYF